MARSHPYEYTDTDRGRRYWDAWQETTESLSQTDDTPFQFIDQLAVDDALHDHWKRACDTVEEWRCSLNATRARRLDAVLASPPLEALATDVSRLRVLRQQVWSYLECAEGCREHLTMWDPQGFDVEMAERAASDSARGYLGAGVLVHAAATAAAPERRAVGLSERQAARQWRGDPALT